MFFDEKTMAEDHWRGWELPVKRQTILWQPGRPPAVSHLAGDGRSALSTKSWVVPKMIGICDWTCVVDCPGAH